MADETEDALKYGNRNNAEDRGRIRKVRALAKEMHDVTMELEPDDEDEPGLLKSADDTLVFYGDAVKALGGGKVGGYLVRFTDEKSPDLTGEFFTKDTNFGDIDTAPVYYHHGMDAKMGKRKIGAAQHSVDDFGVWSEGQLNLRDEYEKFIYSMAEQGKLGWSSGTAPHLVEREQKGAAVWIKSWPLGLDDTLTPTPAEPRNGVMALKSLPHDGALMEPAGVPAADSEPEPQPQPTKSIGGNIMDINQEDLAKMLETAAASGAEKALKSLPAVPTDVKVTKDEGDHPFGNAGEFFQAVKMAALHPSSEDPRLRPLKATGMSEGVPADGGYLLQPQVASGILERMYNTGEILSRVASDPIGPNSNSMLYNAVDETSRVDGSRTGGVLGYWLAEAATKTKSKPAFYQMELKLKKVVALCYATDEQLQDTTNLASWLNRVVPDELRFKVEDAFVNGDGVGKPLGILQAPALVTPLRDTGGSIVFADIVNMWARRWAGVKDYVWLVNQDATPKLDQLVLASSTEMPTRFIDYSPEGTLRIKGRPVIETEYCATLGDQGDIILASLSQYQSIQKGGIQSASSIHVQFVTDETVFRFVYRTDGQPAWHSALTPFKGTNTVSPFVALSSASV